MKSNYNKDGINKVTYDLLFSDKEEIGNVDDVDKKEQIKPT